jgi:hypothetical protein
MGRLVDAGEGDERELHSLRSQAARDFFPDLTIYGEPAFYVSSKVRGCRTCNERGILADAIAASESTRDHTQRAHAWLGELEYRGRCRIDVTVNETHLGANVAARVP